MKKTEDNYSYLGEVGRANVEWVMYEITWRKFEEFLKVNCTYASISLLWYKAASTDMKNLNYTFEGNSQDMLDIAFIGRNSVVVDIFVEHEIMTNIEDNAYDGEREDGDDSDDENYVERPKEDDEPEDSEDEVMLEINGDGLESHNSAQDGDEVVKDAGDGGNDDRFRTVLEEGLRTETKKEAYSRKKEEQEEEAMEAEQSEEEYAMGDEEYPDSPLDSDEEWEQWSNDKNSKRKAKFHGDIDKEPYIWLFQKFNSGLDFKDQLLRYSLNTQFDIKMAKSEANRIAVICNKENCSFRLYCSYEPPINKWMVKVCQMHHNHGKSSRVSMLKQGVIAGLFREELRRNVSLQASEIKDTIKARYNIVVPIGKCYRGRRMALDTILEAQSVQFAKLWDYEYELRRAHRCITTEICTIPVNGSQMFDCFYICFEELRESWKNCCRPLIGLDGCFLKWELNGDLLAAVGRDADNRMYPIAWAVVRGENKDTWGWFLRKLKADLDLGSGDNLTLISDKQKGLVIAIENELPSAEHRMCARHIYANWKKQGFSRSEFKNLFWGVAYSYTEGEYEEKLRSLQEYDQAAYESLLVTEPMRWCRAFFSLESHCSDVHNNLSESFNRTIKIARSKPVVNLLEDIRRQAMRRISRRFLKADKLDTIVTPITMVLLEKARLAKKYCTTIRSSSSLYEVVEFDSGYTVNLSTHQCACRRWDLTGIPCRHTVCVLDDNLEDHEKYVAEYYYTHVFKKNYTNNIKPVNGEKLWKKINKPPIIIPEMRKPRGRPKNRDRRKEPFESLQNPGKATRDGRIPHCSNCKQPGHTKKSCKNATMIVEGPKNKRGRPRKQVDESQCQSTPKQKRKKVLATTSSSHHIPLSENSQHTVVHSSAPEASTSSNLYKPHAKKAPRGKPLKIKKTTNIPRGVGTFWSPYTNRPLDVFGYRVYDRSDAPPQPPE